MLEAVAAYADRGWVCLPPDPLTRDWTDHARGVARTLAADPAHARWLRCEGTWFAGVNLLPNDGAGRLPGGPPLAGPAIDLIRALGLSELALDRGQVSVIHPGYPRPREGENAAAFRYRRDRDAAHLDGLLPVGPDRRRMAREMHGYILGIPLTDTGPGASPLVVWEGSHRIIARAFREALVPHPEKCWAQVDLTEPYHAARREVFGTCRRVRVYARPGAAYLVHRLALHGVAPWDPQAAAPPEGRMIVYFRPQVSASRWLDDSGPAEGATATG